MQSLAQDLAYRCFNEGIGALEKYLNDASSDDHNTSAIARILVGDTIITLGDIIESAPPGFVRISPALPSRFDLLYLRAAKPTEFWIAARNVIATVAAIKSACPRLQVGPKPLDVRTPEEQHAAAITETQPPVPPVVNVTVHPVIHGPIEVAVVSLPQRETIVAVQRDSDGQIIGSKQIESDAVTA